MPELNHDELVQAVKKILRFVVLTRIDVQAIANALPEAEAQRAEAARKLHAEKLAPLLGALETSTLPEILRELERGFEHR